MEQQGTQGMVFDSAPVKQDTAVGMTFDAAPVKQDTAVTGQNPPAAPPHDQPQPGFLSRAKDAIQGVQDFESDVYTGAAKGLGQTINTVSKGIAKVAPSLVRPSDVQALEQMETPTNVAQHIGVAGEGIAEFLLGDEALASLSLGDRMLKVGKIAKMIEGSPRLTRALQIGMAAMKQGTVAGGQTLAHGGTPGEAVGAGATAALTNVATEGAIAGVRAIAPKVKEIAGIAVPVRASQDSAAASALEHVAPSKALERYDVTTTQPEAKKVIGSVATDLRDAGAQRMGVNDTSDFRQAVTETGNGKSFWEMTPAERSKAVARAQELKAIRTAPVANLDEAAQQVKAQSQPVFQKLDEITKDREGGSFNDLQLEARSAWNKGDIQGWAKARKEQDAIFDQFKSQFRPDDLKNARANWQQATALEKVHDSLNTMAIVQPTPVDFRPKGVPDPQIINGKNFTKKIEALRNDGTLEGAGLTKAHIQTLEDLGTLLEKSANVHKLGRLMTTGGALLEGDILVNSPSRALAAAKAGATVVGASTLLGKVLTDPAFANHVVGLLKGAQRAVPGATTQAIRAAFDGASSLSRQQ